MLPKDVATIANSPFRDFQTAIGPEDGARASELIARLYEGGFLHKKEKSISPFHDIDPALLWFINTTGCRRCLALACFMSDASAAKDRTIVCCDNCIYDQHVDEEGLEEVPTFERHGITARHCNRYLATDEYQTRHSNAIHGRRSRPTRLNQVVHEACKVALSDFALSTWPDEMDQYIFPESLREKVATAGARGNIVSIQSLREVLRPTCILETSLLRVHTNTIIEVISSTLAQHDVDRQEGEPDDNMPRGSIDETPRASGRRNNRGESNRNVRGRGRPRGSRAGQSGRPTAPWDLPVDWTIPTTPTANVTASQSQTNSQARSEARKRSQAALSRRESIDESSGPKKKKP